ncbi:MAG: hypothetical protein BVN32_03160 [Proteobacteria bacterium ST_bin14]|nr:MAG: hypothetical protein BVN32_03160 [Proteobacteria bacterium ST_bin14]
MTGTCLCEREIWRVPRAFARRIRRQIAPMQNPIDICDKAATTLFRIDDNPYAVLQQSITPIG